MAFGLFKLIRDAYGASNPGDRCPNSGVEFPDGFRQGPGLRAARAYRLDRVLFPGRQASHKPRLRTISPGVVIDATAILE